MTKDEALILALEALMYASYEDVEYNEDCAAKVLSARNAIKAALAQPEQDQFKPDWNTEAVLVEEMQRMAKRIEELEALAQSESINMENFVGSGKPVVLAKPEQEPVAWRTFDGEGGHDYRSYEMNENYANEWAERNPRHKGWVEPLYTTPPQREWVGLTDKEIDYFCHLAYTGDEEFLLAVQAKLKEKNT